MNIITVAKTIGTVGIRTGVQLLKTGAWGTLNQYTQTQYRNNTSQFIRQVEQGVEHGAHKLKLIKKD